MNDNYQSNAVPPFAEPASRQDADVISVMRMALAALEVATTPLPEDRQKVLKAQVALRATLASRTVPGCLECNGTGEVDSGGTHPWGEPAMIRCGCKYVGTVDTDQSA